MVDILSTTGRGRGYLDASGQDFGGSGLKKLAAQSIADTQTTIAHGLAGTPSVVTITPLGNHLVWESQAADATNVYLTGASATTADVYVAL